MATTDDRGGAVETTRVVPADGDDIVVVPAGAGEPVGPSRRTRVLVGGAIVAILAIVVAIAFLARNSGSSTEVRTIAPTTVSSVAAAARARPTPSVPKATAAAPVVAAPTVPSTSPTPTVAVAPATAPVTTPPPPPPPTTAAPPKQYGASALTWSAPSTLTVASGKTATLAVTAHNPTDGTVTLPHPLSCTPRLDHSEMCPQMVQLIASGQSASERYTIDATGIAKGSYTLQIEGVLTVRVTVS